jgi:hypothetical protein
VGTIAAVRASVQSGRDDVGALRPQGPYDVLGRQFVVETDDASLASTIAAGCVDLEPTGGADPTDTTDTTVYRVAHDGPAWHEHGWSVWRGDEALSPELLGDYVPTMILSDFARHVIRGSDRVVAVSGVALARHEHAVVLVADAVVGWADLAERPLDLLAVAAHCMQRGWGLVALDVVPIDGSGAFVSVDPFHRPFAPEVSSPLAALIRSTRPHELVPASTVGPLVGRVAVGSFVVVSQPDGGASGLDAAAPSTVLRGLAAQLPGRAEVRRTSFVRLAELVERVPGHALRLGGDLGDAVTQLERIA